MHRGVASVGVGARQPSRRWASTKFNKELRFDAPAMRAYCDADDHDLRVQLRALFKDDLFTPRYVMPLEDERELAYQRLKKLCDSGLMSVKYFATAPTKVFTVHEMCGFIDGSLSTKLTVQFNLFGGTVFKLGQAHHHEMLVEGIDSLEDVGCFCLTELGYGNNAVMMETTATYDAATDEFVVNSPSTKSQKYWITNGAVHAHWAVVFAQLVVDGEGHGVHGFVVPVRDKTLKALPGVTIQDMGLKIGLNGIDNGRLWFDKVRIPRTNMLMKQSTVAAGGAFESSIAKKRDRFLSLADQLISGRICIAAMCLGSIKSTIFNVVRYSASREGVGGSGESDTPILAYGWQQREVMPLLCDTIALIAALKQTKALFAHCTEHPDDAKAAAELLLRACSVKPLMSWLLERIANVGRERCGGQGYLSANRFGEAIAAAHAGMTAEGDNRVLIQKVAKECLDDKSQKSAIAKTLGISKLPSLTLRRVMYGTNGFDPKSAATQGVQKLFAARVLLLKAKVAEHMMQAKKRGREAIFDTWMGDASADVQRLGIAVGEQYVLDSFVEEASAVADPGTRALLTRTAALYAKNRVAKELDWYITEGLLSISQAAALRDSLAAGCVDLANDAVHIVNSFGVEDHMNWAPIGRDWEEYNAKGEDNQGEVAPGHRWQKAASA